MEKMENLMKEIKDALDSERLVTARLVESVARVAQLAGGATPESQELFSQWVSIISRSILAECEGGEIDIEQLANKIGVKETTLLSLVLAMQRGGSLRVEKIHFSKDVRADDEVCNCLK